MAKRKKSPRPSAAAKTTEPAVPSPRRRNILPVAFLIAVTLIVFSSVASHPFITLDDHDYVVRNEVVQRGLNGAGIAWAFTTFHAANWHPVTWLSHMLDVSLFELRPGAHLLMNVFLHALAAAALFAALHALTGHPGRSVAVALFFAIHPLAVQSAAWVSERKNVLCALFWFLALWAYARYARSRGSRDYLLVVLFFALSLLSKPMAVTFPAALLLIDYWPLRRFRIAEKIPLFVLSAISSLVTLQAQRAGRTVQTLDALPFMVRAENAIVAYARYLAKTFWPRDLAIFYPYSNPSMAYVAVAAFVLIAITAVAFVTRKRWPFLLVGWLWFLGTLVPMIGLVQVGEQSMADRYTYVPLVGIFIALVWLVAELMPPHRILQPALVAVICSILAIITRMELRHWRNSFDLFNHAIAAAGPSALAHNSLGGAFIEEGQIDRGEAEFRKALAISPRNLDARVNLANALARQNRTDEAIAAYRAVLEIDRTLPDIHNNLGIALARQGNIAEATTHVEEALRVDPNFEPAKETLRFLQRYRQ